MYIVSVLNEMNIYERDSDIHENPVGFVDFSEAITFAKPLIEQDYEVIIKHVDEKNDDK